MEVGFDDVFCPPALVPFPPAGAMVLVMSVVDVNVCRTRSVPRVTPVVTEVETEMVGEGVVPLPLAPLPVAWALPDDWADPLVCALLCDPAEPLSTMLSSLYNNPSPSSPTFTFISHNCHPAKSQQHTTVRI